MPRIVLSSSMLRDYARLPQDVAGKVSNLITNFAQQAFAGAHIETPKAARDPQARTVRIDNFCCRGHARPRSRRRRPARLRRAL